MKSSCCGGCRCLRASQPSKLKLLAFTSDRMSFDPGQILFEQGDAGDAAYVVLYGTAEVLVNRAGSQIKVADLEKNSIVGEIAILCDVPRTATVRAHDRSIRSGSARTSSCGSSPSSPKWPSRSCGSWRTGWAARRRS